MMFEFIVDTTKVEEELRDIKSRFPRMVETMKRIALLIELNTTKYVPLDTSALEQSYTYQTVTSSNFILMAVGYDAIDEDSGFHYAEYQHEEDLNHPRRGIQFYLREGITDSKGEMFQMIEQDYLSLFTGKSIGKATTGDNAHAGFIWYMNM